MPIQTVTHTEASRIARSYGEIITPEYFDRANDCASQAPFAYQLTAAEYLHHWYGENNRVAACESRSAAFDDARLA